MVTFLGKANSREAADFDRRFWLRLGVRERFAKTWDLSVEAYRLAGQKDGTESRLQRSVVRLRRK
jgi:hypothetical protein